MTLGLNHNQTSIHPVRWVRPAQHGGARTPTPAFVTFALSSMLMAFMLFESTLGRVQASSIVNTMGLRADIWSWTDVSSYSRLFTFTLLHADAKHFFWNVTLLVLVGSVVEWRIGWRAVFLLLVAGAIVSGLSHVLLFPSEAMPLIGASGLVSTLFGTAMVIAGGVGIRIRIPHTSRWFNLNLNRLLLFWLATQIAGLVLVIGPTGMPLSIAYWVHLAGFGVGVAGGFIFQNMTLYAPRVD